MCLRPLNVFYCPQYAASKSSWTENDGTLSIEWGRYGSYDLTVKEDNSLEGSVRGDPSKWRKMAFLRPFSAEETLLNGDGGGSAWNFEWSGGAFEVEFRTDSLNHFVCPSFPEHSHWTMDDENKITIDWGKYGIFDFNI